MPNFYYHFFPEESRLPACQGLAIENNAWSTSSPGRGCRLHERYRWSLAYRTRTNRTNPPPGRACVTCSPAVSTFWHTLLFSVVERLEESTIHCSLWGHFERWCIFRFFQVVRQRTLPCFPCLAGAIIWLFLGLDKNWQQRAIRYVN